jgi:hypothetical protein
MMEENRRETRSPLVLGYCCYDLFSYVTFGICICRFRIFIFLFNNGASFVTMGLFVRFRRLHHMIPELSTLIQFNRKIKIWKMFLAQLGRKNRVNSNIIIF